MEHQVEHSPNTTSVDWDDPKYHTYTSFLRPSTNNHANNTDPLMGRTSYRWSFNQQKPNNSALTVADIQGSRSAIAWFKPDVPGFYTLNLAVKGHGCTYTDPIKLNVVDTDAPATQQLLDDYNLDDEYYISACSFKPENTSWSASSPNTTALKRQISSKKTSLSPSQKGNNLITASQSKDQVIRDVRRRLKSSTSLSNQGAKLKVKGGVKKKPIKSTTKGRTKASNRKRAVDYDDDEDGGEDDDDDDDMPIGAQGGYEDDDDEDLEGMESGDDDDENLGDAPGGGDDGGDDGGDREGAGDDSGDHGHQDDDDDDDEDEIEIEEEEDEEEDDEDGAEPTQEAEDEGQEMKDNEEGGNLYDDNDDDVGGDADLGPIPHDPSLDDDADEEMDDYEHPPDIIPEGDEDDEDEDEADPMPDDDDDDGDDEDDEDAGQVEGQDDDEDEDDDEDVDE